LAEAQFLLGRIRRKRGELAGAETALKEAIRLRHDYPAALCELGIVLCHQGRFAEGLPYLRRGHEQGSRQPGWSQPAGEWVAVAEKLIQLDQRLTAVLRGEVRPSHTQSLELADFCRRFKSWYAAETRLLLGVFTARPGLANDVGSGRRFRAAQAAA